MRLSTPHVTIFDADSEGYIYPAIKLFKEGGFTHISSRSYVYSLFVFVVLKLGISINYIFLVQHSLSLVTLLGMIFFIEFVFLKNNLNKDNDRLKKVGFIVLNFCMLFFIFCYGNLIAFEKMLRPEGLLIPSFLVFFVALALFFNKKAMGIFLLNVLVLSFLVLLHPRFSVGFYSVLFLIVVCFIKLNCNNVKRLASGVFFAACIFLIVMIPEKILISKYDQSSGIFAFKQFYYAQLPAIKKALSNGDYIYEDYDIKILSARLNNSVLDDSNFIIGYNLDYFQYEIGDNELVQSLAINKLKSHSLEFTLDECLKVTNNICDKVLTETRDAYHEYYKNWFKLLILKYPFEVIRKTLKQIFNFLLSPEYSYFSVNPGYFTFEKVDTDFDLTEQYLQEIQFYDKNFFSEFSFGEYYLLFFNLSDKFLRILFLIAALLSVFTIRNNFLMAAMIWVSFSTIILVSFTHTFDLYRYAYSLVPVNILIIYLFFADILIGKNKV